MNPPVLLNSPLIRRKMIEIKKGKTNRKRQRKKKLDVIKSHIYFFNEEEENQIPFAFCNVLGAM